MIEQSAMITKAQKALKGLQAYYSIMRDAENLHEQGKALGENLDLDPELKIEINSKMRQKAAFMFQMKESLNAVREVFM